MEAELLELGAYINSSIGELVLTAMLSRNHTVQLQCPLGANGATRTNELEKY